MLGAPLLAALALQASAPSKGGADAFDLALQGKNAAGVKLAETMYRGFQACGKQIATRKHLTSANAAELKKAGLALSTKPPAEVSAVAATVFKQSPIYAQVSGAAAGVWVVGSAKVPVCRVIVADTAHVLSARKELETQFAASKSWAADASQSYTREGVVRQAYVLGKGKPGQRLMAFIDGPGETADGGKGIQAIITVGVSKAQSAGATKTDKK